MTDRPFPSLDDLSAALAARYTAAREPAPEVVRVLAAVNAYDYARRALAIRALADLVGVEAPPSPTTDLAALAQGVYEAVLGLPHLPTPQPTAAASEANHAPRETVLDLPFLRASEVDRRPVFIVGGTLTRAVEDRLKVSAPGVVFESSEGLPGTLRARLIGALAKGRVRGVIVVLDTTSPELRAVVDMECRSRHVTSADVTSLAYEKFMGALVTLNRLVGEGPTSPPSALR